MNNDLFIIKPSFDIGDKNRLSARFNPGEFEY